MFILTTKITKRKVIIIALASLVLMTALIVPSFVSTQHASADAEVKLTSNTERVNYLKGFGWDVVETPAEILEVMIPSEFSDTYIKYNEIQVSQGFDLVQYQGKRAKRYAYKITNYPTGEEGVIAHIFIYKNRVIAGDVLSPSADGFIHGLNMP